ATQRPNYPMTPHSPVKDVPPSAGLTSDEGRRRIEKFGPNTIPDATLHPLRRALTKFRAYTYDALNRVASAQTTQTGTQWGQSYTYDGFGNLTDQTVIKGSAPDVHVAHNASDNLQTGDTADANGNIGAGYVYDLDNRLVQPGSSSTVHYGYDAGNKRVWRGDTSVGLDEITFWAGQKLATYQVSTSNNVVFFTRTSTRVYFGSKLISKGTYNSAGTGDKVTLAPVATDRQGSIGKFYPFGTERPSATANNTEKFTGYYRDASTGLDYADQRYEQPGVGRFMSPDPYGGSAKASNPGSWNRYPYVGGDPINHADPRGLCGVAIGGIVENSSNTPSLEGLGANGIVAFPYGQGTITDLVSIITHDSTSTSVARAAIMDAYGQGCADINILTFSGGAQAFSDAYADLPDEVKATITNVVYAMAGNTVLGVLPAGTQSTSYIIGNIEDELVPALGLLPSGTTILHLPECGHSVDCLVAQDGGFLTALLFAENAPTPFILDRTNY
ncbi:MAG TPA: RHS repeat-associated core domain-containing protein, partial [Puia sp.]|nr:RHS repeat-associated core domain-containing protein [Puia sp.]